MKFVVLVVLIVMTITTSFPPTDVVISASGVTLRENNGFTFLPRVGGAIQIRYGQWFTQLGMTLLVGLGAIWIARRPNDGRTPRGKTP
jgi:hypothetical protein